MSLGPGRLILGLAMISGGYALAYYGINVLVWAHLSDSTADPVPLRLCLGIPGSDGGSGKPFMPPLQLGAQIPGAITDARGLLGGTPTTGQYNQVLPKGGMFLTPAGGAPATGGGGSPTGSAGGGGGAPASRVPLPAATAPSGGSTPASGANQATGAYVQEGGLVQQNQDGTWSLTPGGLRASHGG